MPEALSSVTALPMSGCSFTSTQFWLPRAVLAGLVFGLALSVASTVVLLRALGVATLTADFAPDRLQDTLAAFTG